MSYSTLLVDYSDKICTVTINRPEALNALNATVIDELWHLFQSLSTNDEVLGVILTGTGKSFVAGADIRELAKQKGTQAIALARKGQHLLYRIENLGKPVIAAINGYALGGGCEIAMACTFRIASEKARLGQPEVKLGIIPGYGGTQRLPRLVGKGKAMELILTGEPIKADEAYRIGLVNHVVAADELLPFAVKLMKKMIAQAPRALALAMEAVNHGTEMSLEQGLRLEADLFGLSFFTDDAGEGIRAFLEKRTADFKGK